MTKLVTTVTIGVLVVAIIGAATLSSLRDGNTERLITFLAIVLAAIPSVLNLSKTERQDQNIEAVRADVAEVKHQTNGKLTELVDTVKDAVASQPVPSPDGTVQGTADGQAR